MLTREYQSTIFPEVEIWHVFLMNGIGLVEFSDDTCSM